MRILLATLLLVGLVSAPARAEEIGVRIVSQSARQAEVLIEPGGARIDFGHVAIVERSDSRRGVRVGNQGTHFVATFELEIVATRASYDRSTRRTSTISSTPTHGDWGGRRLGMSPPKPMSVHAPSPTGRTVDLVASLASGGVEDGSVRLVVGDSPDWSASPEVGQVLGPASMPIAWGLRAGDRVRCEVSLYATAQTSGLQEATIRFSVR